MPDLSGRTTSCGKCPRCCQEPPGRCQEGAGMQTHSFDTSGRSPSCDKRCPEAPHTHAAEEAFVDWWTGRCVTAGCLLPSTAGASYCNLHVVRWNREADPLTTPARPSS